MTGDTRLSRALLEAGGLDAILEKDSPDLRFLTDAERRESLHSVLAARPVGDVWLFAYGSLIWNPIVRSVEQRTARIEGWHRAFCLSTTAGRGSIEYPGLVLALDEGGSCEGIAFRLAEDDVEGELALLWRREMVTDAYIPRWIDLLDQHGACFNRGIAFTIDRTGEQYAGDLAGDELVQRLATGTGSLGSSADYLFRTRDGLCACGIPDATLDRLAADVRSAQALNSTD